MPNCGNNVNFLKFECSVQNIKENVILLLIVGSYQVPRVAYLCKIAYGSVPNLSNYGHLKKIHFACLF